MFDLWFIPLTPCFKLTGLNIDICCFITIFYVKFYNAQYSLIEHRFVKFEILLSFYSDFVVDDTLLSAVYNHR